MFTSGEDGEARQRRAQTGSQKIRGDGDIGGDGDDEQALAGLRHAVSGIGDQATNTVTSFRRGGGNSPQIMAARR